MLRIGLALIASLGLAGSAEADCAFYGLLAKPLTPAGTAIPDDGGIVIGAIADQRGTLDPGDAALQAAFRWKGTTTKQVMVPLAPGLAVMRVPGSAAPTELVDGKGTAVLAVTRAKAARARLPAPRVSAVTHESHRGRRGIERVMVAFDDVPAGAIAIVLFDARGKARSWGLIEAKPATATPPDARAPVAGTPPAPRPAPIVLPAFASHDCKALPNGTVPSKAGDRVIVRFVDEVGRLSPASKPLVVKAGP